MIGCEDEVGAVQRSHHHRVEGIGTDADHHHADHHGHHHGHHKLHDDGGDGD